MKSLSNLKHKEIFHPETPYNMTFITINIVQYERRASQQLPRQGRDLVSRLHTWLRHCSSRGTSNQIFGRTNQSVSSELYLAGSGSTYQQSVWNLPSDIKILLKIECSHPNRKLDTHLFQETVLVVYPCGVSSSGLGALPLLSQHSFYLLSAFLRQGV